MGDAAHSPFTLELDRGEAYLQAGRFEEAETHLGRALEIDPDSGPANLAAAHAAMARSDWIGATRHYQLAAKADPASAAAEIGWGRALVARERVEQALWHFDRAATLDEEATEPLTLAGDMLFEFARSRGPRTARGARALEEAESRLSAAATHDAVPVWAILRLGEVRQERNAFRRALEAYQMAVKRDPDLLPARIGVAETANNLERYGQARRAIEPVLEPVNRAVEDASSVISTARARVTLVASLIGLREWERGRAVICEAIEAVDTLASDTPELEEFCKLLTALMKVQDSGLLVQLGLFDEAIIRAEEGVDSGGGARPYGLLALITAHKERGDYGAMAETLMRAETLIATGSLEEEDDDEDKVAVARLRAAVLDAKDRPEEAYEFLLSAVVALPKMLELRMELVQLLTRERQAAAGVHAACWQHRLVRAVDAARRTLVGREHLPSVALSLGALEILGGAVQDARKRLLGEVDRDPGSYQVHALLGAAHARLGENKEACESFATAVQLAPHNLAYKLALATVYVRLGNSVAAESCYREVLVRAPTNIEALVGLGSVLGTREEADSDMYTEADELLVRALDAANTMSGDLSRQSGSIRLSKVRRAAIYHEIGVVRARQFESEADSNPLRRRPRLLRSARRAFASAIAEDDGMFLARRAKSRIDREYRTLGAERPKWVLLVTIGVLLVVLASAFFVHVPHLHQLTGPTYSAMTLGLLVLLMASLYLDRLRSLRIAGVSMEKEVEFPTMARKLGVEADPDIIELLQIPVESPSSPPPADTDLVAPEQPQPGGGRAESQATQGSAPGAQAASTAQHGVHS